MLNSRELLEEGIVTGPIDNENISQVGIDLNVISIESIVAGGGYIPKTGKTQLNGYRECPSIMLADGTIVYTLEPGAYNVEMAQGCSIPEDVTLLIRQRSSLLRNGASLHSSVFDPGFKTDSIGTVLVVHVPLRIEKGARICQIYGHRNTPVKEEDLYDGQWQNDSQRNG